MKEGKGAYCKPDDAAGHAHGVASASRRRLLGGALAGAVASVVAGSELAVSSVASAQTIKSPDEALQALVNGNRRFVKRKLTFYQQDLAILQQNTAEKQEPFASVLSCADSRVPVELIFDQSIGHVFVNRIAGNIATSEIVASIEYGAAVLGTKVIVVLAHGNCGAVQAAIAGKAVLGQITSLYLYLRPAINAGGENLRAATEANAKIQAQLLKEASPVLGGLIKEGKLSIVAAFFDIETGKVTLLT
jgi:carbonic anhydrase